MFSLSDLHIGATFAENWLQNCKSISEGPKRRAKCKHTGEMFCYINVNIDIRQANKEGR